MEASDTRGRDEKTRIALTEQEWFLLERGLTEWGGPARCTEAFATAMGFKDVDDLLNGDGERIYRDLRHHRPMSRVDWVRALLATEIVFASHIVGSGWDWPDTTGSTDEETITLLRGVQGKIPRSWVASR
jgi:hypothetical protein